MRAASPSLPIIPLAPLCLLALTSCAQGVMSRTGVDILSSVVLAGGPAASGRTPMPAPRPIASAPRIIATAEDYLGVRYKWGGNTPNEGFDCSGYVKYVFARQGIQLPRTSREQARAGEKVAARVSSLRQGDLMLFAERSTISHVAIYAGG
jgi:cell wall-associated NlpC family hydrolase